MTAPPPGFEPESRARNVETLAREHFDVLIIGGGINGAGIARDLALRSATSRTRLRVGLIEKRHFSSGTSGRNSQLIHGGLRYLEHFEFRLVREALQERATLLRIAPHLVEPLPLIIPFYGWFSRRYYGAGLWLYDQLAGRRNIASRRYLSLADIAALEPGLARTGLHSAAIFYDCRVHSSRVLLENLFDASRAGAVIANYAEAERWSRLGDVFHVPVVDRLTGSRFTVRASRLVDARGPWEGSDRIRLVRGSHIILPRVNHSANAIAHFGADGRIIFIIPWGPGDSLSLIGTTDIDHSSGPDDVRISNEEVRYLRNVVATLFPHHAGVEPLAAYSSLRPLLAAPGAKAQEASRSHRIWLEDDVLKIAGGKFTTYRSMAEEAVDLLRPDLAGRSSTASLPLGGNTAEAITALAERFHPSLVRLFGVQTPLVDKSSVVSHAVRHEMARRLPDVMFTSTYWGHEHPWDAESLFPYAREMGSLLGWDDSRVEQEIALTLAIAAMPEPD